MLGLDHDHYAKRLQPLEQSIRDLLGQALLNLKPSGKNLGYPCEFRQADDPAAFWDIGDVALAHKGCEMVLADGRDRDVLHEDHLVVQMTGQGPSAIFASGPREFFPEDIEAQFVFAESGTAPAQSLVLNQDGQTYKAQRIAEESKP